MQDEVVVARDVAGDVELAVPERVRPGERLGERGAELAAGARDQDAWESRAERIGSFVCHRSTTRGSSQGIPCSSGSAGSYSSVTW